MFSLRPAVRAVSLARCLPASQNVALGGWLSKQPFSSVVEQDDGEEEDSMTVLQNRRDELTNKGKHLVWESPDQMPAPVLPENPAEIAALDSMADVAKVHRSTGAERLVLIRQDQANVKQSPLHVEKTWRISFVEDGTSGEKWENSLMGWTSNGDPYQSEPPLTFTNALDAVYFAKKRGWKFLVKEPIMRVVREDGAQYQDNFLPQAVTARLAKERHACDQWKRTEAGTSHYFRPLRYHGKGVVPQYGCNPDQKEEPHVEGYYKRR